MILEFSGPCLENLFTARPYSLIGRSIISVRSRSLQNQINKGYRVRALLGARRRKSRGSTWSPQKKKQGLYLEPAEEKAGALPGARGRKTAGSTWGPRERGSTDRSCRTARHTCT